MDSVSEIEGDEETEIENEFDSVDDFDVDEEKDFDDEGETEREEENVIDCEFVVVGVVDEEWDFVSVFDDESLSVWEAEEFGLFDSDWEAETENEAEFV